MKACFLIALPVSCLLLTGCSSEPVAKIYDTVPAAGLLTYKGQPLPGYLVSFQPTKSSRTAAAVTDSEGKFVLGTNAVNDGAVPGQHAVAVVWQPPVDDGTGDVIDDPSKLPRAPVDLPVQYANASASGIVVEIPAGGDTEITIKLE